MRRLSKHADSSWAANIVKVALEHLPNHARAHAAEEKASRSERPLHNLERYDGRPKGARKGTLGRHLPMPESINGRPAAEWCADFAMSRHSPERVHLIKTGTLRPLYWEKWKAGGYGPDPFGIKARATPQLATPIKA